MNHHSSSDQFDNLLNEPVENQSTAESYWSSQSKLIMTILFEYDLESKEEKANLFSSFINK